MWERNRPDIVHFDEVQILGILASYAKNVEPYFYCFKLNNGADKGRKVDFLQQKATLSHKLWIFLSVWDILKWS